MVQVQPLEVGVVDYEVPPTHESHIKCTCTYMHTYKIIYIYIYMYNSVTTFLADGCDNKKRFFVNQLSAKQDGDNMLPMS